MFNETHVPCEVRNVGQKRLGMRNLVRNGRSSSRFLAGKSAKIISRLLYFQEQRWLFHSVLHIEIIESGGGISMDFGVRLGWTPDDFFPQVLEDHSTLAYRHDQLSCNCRVGPLRKFNIKVTCYLPILLQSCWVENDSKVSLEGEAWFLWWKYIFGSSHLWEVDQPLTVFEVQAEAFRPPVPQTNGLFLLGGVVRRLLLILQVVC